MPHPYTTTSAGLVGAIRQLRSTFPNVVNADTLKKWSIAPNNEGTVLVVLRHLGVVDEEGRKQPEPAKVFLEHDDAAFAKSFATLVRKAYADLFELWSDQAWTLDRDKLINFFRTTDESSARVGTQQAATFVALAGLAGHGPPPAIAADAPRTKTRGKASKPGPSQATNSALAETARQSSIVDPTAGVGRGPALTVRIEINLPVSEQKEVYDNIFRSIRANLLNEPPSK